MTPQELKNSILQLAIQGKLVEQRAEEGTGRGLLEEILAAKNAEGAKGRGNKLTRSRGVRGGGEDEGISNLPKAAKSQHSNTLSALSPLLGHPLRGQPSAGGYSSPREEISDDEKPFDIPESWEWVRLERIVNSVPSKQYQILESEVRTSGKFAVISQSKEYSIGFTDISEKVYHHVTPVIVFGDHTTEVKYVEFDFVVGADGVKIFEPLDGLLFAKYLFYVLLFNTYDLSKVGGYSRHYKFLKNKPIPLPPLAEQKRIVAKIEELMPLVERYEKAWSKLEDFNKRFPVDMQKSVLQMAIQGKLVEQRVEEGTGRELLERILAAKNAKGAKSAKKGYRATSAKSAKESRLASNVSRPVEDAPFDIPESWEWVRLGEIMLDVSTGPFGSMLHKADYCDGGIPLVNPMNIQNGRIVPSDKMRVSTKTAERLSAYRLSKGMIVVARRGELGRCASVGDEQDGWLCGTGSFFLDPSKDIFVPFITLIISSPYARQLFAGKAVGTTMANLNHNLLKALPIPLPPLAEQKRIVAKLEELLPLCERLKR